MIRPSGFKRLKKGGTTFSVKYSIDKIRKENIPLRVQKRNKNTKYGLETKGEESSRTKNIRFYLVQ